MDWLNDVAEVAERNQWPHERLEEAVSMVLPGRWGSYQVVFQSDLDSSIKVAGGFELRVPAMRVLEVRELVRLINKKFDVGRFEYDLDDHLVAFSVILRDSAGDYTTDSYYETATDVVKAVDVYYPAFMRVVWAMISPESAMAEIEHMAGPKSS